MKYKEKDEVLTPYPSVKHKANNNMNEIYLLYMFTALNIQSIIQKKILVPIPI